MIELWKTTDREKIMWKTYIRKRKMQTGLMFLVIVFCSMLMTAAGSILVALDRPFQEFARECKAPAAIMFPHTVDSGEVNALKNQFEDLAEVKNVEETKYYSLKEKVTYEGKEIEAFLRLAVYQKTVNKNAVYLAGTAQDAANLQEGECMLPACVANKYKIQKGDTIRIGFTDGKKEYTVKGIYADPYNISTAIQSSILLNRLPENVQAETMFYLYGEKGADGNDMEQSYRETYGGQMNGSVWDSGRMLSNSLVAAHIIGAILLALGVILLLVSVLIICFMLRSNLKADEKNVAVYRTIGYGNGDILKSYIQFYMLVISAGSILGIVLSALISKLVLSGIYQNIGKLPLISPVIPGLLVYGFIVILTMGAAVMILEKNRHVRPAAVLGGQTGDGVRRRKKYKGDSKLQFSPAGIAIRQITRGKKDILGILLTCIITVFAINILVMATDMAATMKENNDYWLGLDKCDVVVEVPKEFNLEKVNEVLKQDKRVEQMVFADYSRNMTLEWHPGMEMGQLAVFIYQNMEDGEFRLIEGRNPEGANEIALAAGAAQKLKKEVGDYITVYLANEKRTDLLITGIYQSYYEFGDISRVDSSVFEENREEVSYNHISIYLKNGEERSKFIKDMEATLPEIHIMDREEEFPSIMSMIMDPQEKALPPVMVLVLVLGGINIFCIVLLKNMENWKNNCIYKSIGYSESHLIRGSLVYVGIIAAGSLLTAIPLAIVLFPVILTLSLSMFGMKLFPVAIIPGHLLLANGLILFLFLAATRFSSGKIREADIRDLVQE